ncbi:MULTISPECIES: protein-L-isoaspartate O-methyltransferase [Pseudoxanthomonas]|uniref:Protein-L-isoaspartate O-methyltransferase n=1 Tax=Pseudoxanthomonas winnipegensis TaxID=2480810 RepID=A0AAW8GA88_9GAMM|nr:MULTISPECIES: protein-L-isoaspartate O-methyltransferase [Pseudoxanthomonas]MDQ1118113.1 protein-L-isoaspartate(D-aspartate) O-methyltransferase [Pseudoxanthomonas winnipegensis]MDQ1135083.1 protein-L-isoaspartate(D-aspartate) O-methyltransferase [Pseudoxanthomonas winnipegensis]MDR6138686.1 protein-L-isoaspartate(D-aspartate) O-methyltransferase [Pseudoxanthomonas sp. SORGH_AS_0997]
MTINYAQARENMVEQQIRPWDVLEPRVLDTLATLPREAFVPPAHRAVAYADLELPLGHGQRMMKPVVEGRVLQALDVQPGEDVLEIGTGSGFLTACLAALGREVVSLELHPELAAFAQANLQAAGLGSNVRIETADALAWATDRKFDAVCITAAVDTLPLGFMELVRPGGRLFVVRGRSPAMEAVLVHNDTSGARIESLFETDALGYLVGAAPVPAFVF